MIYLLSVLALFGVLSVGQVTPPVIAPSSLADFQNITLYSQYAAAAYCDANNNVRINPNPQLNCSGAIQPTQPGGLNASNCPMVEASGASTVLKFGLTPTYNTTGFVAVDNPRKLIVVSFRGSDGRSSQSFTNNLIARDNQDPVPYCDNCAGARGYFGAYLEVNASVVQAVQQQLGLHQGYRVVTTGHSQGGAIATFAALELRRMNISVHAASFGMPRTANPLLANFLTAQDPPFDQSSNPDNRNFRVIHAGDYIPDSLNLTETVDTADNGGTIGNVISSRHIAPSINITTPSGVMPTNDNVFFNNTDGTAQVVGVDWGTFLSDFAFTHGYYFGNISACV